MTFRQTISIIVTGIMVDINTVMPTVKLNKRVAVTDILDILILSG
jgi:hypothetical protein